MSNSSRKRRHRREVRRYENKRFRRAAKALMRGGKVNMRNASIKWWGPSQLSARHLPPPE